MINGDNKVPFSTLSSILNKIIFILNSGKFSDLYEDIFWFMRILMSYKPINTFKDIHSKINSIDFNSIFQYL